MRLILHPLLLWYKKAVLKISHKMIKVLRTVSIILIISLIIIS